jgi:predicted transcriptional regulator
MNSEEETHEILTDVEMLTAIAEGLAEIQLGDVVSLEDVKKQLERRQS